MSEYFSGIGDWLGNNASWLAPTALAAGTALYSANANRGAAQTQQNALAQGAQMQQQSADNSLNFLRDAYNTTRADQSPYRQAGQQALSTLTPQVTGQFQEGPGYAFAFNEGQRAVESSAAARGMLNSGATAKALTRYGQGMANQEYGNYLNRLSALSGTGQTAANYTGQAAQNYGGNAAGVSTGLGNSLAQNYGQQGQVNANGQTSAAGNYLSGANSLLGYFGSNSQSIFGGGNNGGMKASY